MREYSRIRFILAAPISCQTFKVLLNIGEEIIHLSLRSFQTEVEKL